MKWLLFFIVTAIFFGFLGIVYLVNPGSLEIIWFGYNIQLSAILAFIILIFLMSILLLVGYSILWLINLPSKWANHHKKSQESNVETELLNLLMSYEAENFNVALELTQKMKKNLKKILFFSGLLETFSKKQNTTWKQSNVLWPSLVNQVLSF